MQKLKKKYPTVLKKRMVLPVCSLLVRAKTCLKRNRRALLLDQYSDFRSTKKSDIKLSFHKESVSRLRKGGGARQEKD